MARSTWSNRDDVWCAHVAAALATGVGLFGVLGASGARAPAEVAVATTITVAGFEAKAHWPRLPSLVLALWTFAPAIVVNLWGLSEGTLFLVVVATCFVTLTEPDRRIRMAIGAAAVLVPGLVELFGNHPFSWPFWMIGIAFGWLSGAQMRQFRILLDQLEAARHQLAAQAVHLERRRIAADLHDLVGHSLTVVLLHLTGARRQLEHDPAGVADALLEAEEIGRAGLAEIRANVAALRDSTGAAMTPTPGAEDVTDLVQRVAAAGPAVDLHVTGDLDTVEAIVGVVVYRVVQESLNNAARHAPGAEVRVEVSVEPGAVCTSVIDTGGTTALASGTGVGLIGMRERVEALGGTLHAGPEAAGWAVRAWVPRPAALADHRTGEAPGRLAFDGYQGSLACHTEPPASEPPATKPSASGPPRSEPPASEARA